MTAAAQRIALLLPHAYRGGTMRLLVNLARHLGTRWPGPLVLALPTDHLSAVADDLALVRRELSNIEIRGLNWQRLAGDAARSAAAAAGLEVDRWISAGYQVPSDGGADFRDCGFWLFVSDRLELPLVPLERYGVLVTDHLQRYVPEIFDATMYAESDSGPWNFLRNVRNADVVAAMSRDTVADAVAYAGARGRVVRMPTTIDVDHFMRLADVADRTTHDIPVSPSGAPFIAWVTNASPHKNHLRMLRALDVYERASGQPLDVIVTGLGTDLFDPDLPGNRRIGREDHWNMPYVRTVREMVAAARPSLRRRLHFLGCVSDPVYASVLRSARFVVHNVIADNGTFSVVEAALLGCPSISSDYPQMREIDDEFGLEMRFFDPFDERDTAAALLAGETLSPPSGAIRQRICDHSWRSWDDSLITAIQQTMAADRRRIACL
jgi:glycosyltransferase involved in cell wall biosynthesis